MRVHALQQFLRSLVPALEAGDARSAAQGISEACRALEPFGPLGLPEFAAFLVRAAEYQRAGVIRVPGPTDVRADELLGALARLSNSNDPSAAQADVARAVDALAREAGLKGTVSPDPKWADARALRARVEPHLSTIRSLASRISSPEMYMDDSVRTEIARLEAALDRDSLKGIGAEFGVSVSSRSDPAKVLADVLVKLSGHSAPKAKRGAKASVEPADPAVVEENARHLVKLIERSATHEAVSDNEVEAELARLKVLPKPVLVAVAVRAGIEGVKARDAVGSILTRVRNRLTAARRARERAEV
jgi:hypothetical protein